MRTLIATSALGVTMLFCSCSSPSVTKADLKNFKLRDLKVWGTPPIVKVDESTLHRSEDFLAYYDANDPSRRRSQRRPTNYKPVDFRPPELPDAATSFDGSLLPPKEGSSSAVLNGDAGPDLSGEEDYSIE